MISGSEGKYDLILRTGAWGKDIIVPTAIAGVLTPGVAAIPVAAVSGYRAHAFEKKFWDYIKKTLSEIGGANATMSDPVTVTHSIRIRQWLDRCHSHCREYRIGMK